MAMKIVIWYVLFENKFVIMLKFSKLKNLLVIILSLLKLVDGNKKFIINNVMIVKLIAGKIIMLILILWCLLGIIDVIYINKIIMPPIIIRRRITGNQIENILIDKRMAIKTVCKMIEIIIGVGLKNVSIMRVLIK